MSTCIAPEPEVLVEEEAARPDEPEPDWKQRLRELLVAVFQGHEEYLGWTPD
jgi:hypothetical protein